MKASSAAWLVSAAVLGIVGFFAGQALAKEPASGYAFATDAPGYTAAETTARFSKGGFSGFGEVAGFEGRTVLGGRIVAIESGSIVLESAAGVRSTVPLGNSTLGVIRPGGRGDLRIGVTVVVRTEPGSETTAAAVLVLP
ncbi:MAG: hypothetical protein GEU75_12770 [Dehalococcoidia bacterium]|nr:hypothetical protein [Dehalococcoidia bacterium]